MHIKDSIRTERLATEIRGIFMSKKCFLTVDRMSSRRQFYSQEMFPNEATVNR